MDPIKEPSLKTLEDIIPPEESLAALFNVYIEGNRSDLFLEMNVEYVENYEQILQRTYHFLGVFKPNTDQMMLEYSIIKGFQMIAYLYKKQDYWDQIEQMRFMGEFHAFFGCIPFTEEELLTLIDGFEQSILEAPEEPLNEKNDYVKSEWYAAKEFFETKTILSERAHTLTDYINFIQIFLQHYELRDEFYFFYQFLLTLCYIHVLSHVLYESEIEEPV
jgi:hypothetical protein